MLKKLVVYITPSCFDDSFFKDLVLSLKDSLTDVIELGIPFSDPVADGKIIQEINLKALLRGFVLENIIERTSFVSNIMETYWMGYANFFYKNNFKYLLEIAKEHKLKGFIVPDLPYEEAQPYKLMAKEKSLSIIDFISPLSDTKRISMITKNSHGFIYLISHLGTTGSSSKKENLDLIIKDIKKNTNIPVYVGFGVNEKTAKWKSKNADGVIIGSTLLKVALDDSLTSNKKILNMSKVAKNIKEAINS